MSAHPRQQIISFPLLQSYWIKIWFYHFDYCSTLGFLWHLLMLRVWKSSLSLSFSFFSQPIPQTILRWWQWKPQELKLWDKRTLLSVFGICGSKKGTPCWFFSVCSTTLPQMWVQLWKLTEYSNKSQFSNQRTEKKTAENLENKEKIVNRKDLWKVTTKSC